MKRILSALLVAVMVIALAVSFASCNGSDGDSSAAESSANAVSKDAFKIGLILLHNEDSTYDANFINSAKAAVKELGLKDEQLIIVRDVGEDSNCYEAAANLVDEGCNVVFADSFGHEDYMIQAAKEFKNVQFCHATGTKAHTEKLSNFHNAFAQIYEGRYLAGVAAGMKLNEMIAEGKFTAEEAKMGYVGAWTYAEVISGYTSFYLGAKSVCPTVTMEVQFTGSWYDYDLEKNAAEVLIGRGCKLISGHADSMGAPTVCQEKGVPNVAYNGSTVADCPDTFIVSSKIDWAPYFKYICQQVMDGKAIDTDWCGTLATGSVALTEVNEKAAAKGTKEALEAAKKDLMDGKVKVFDTATFTVEGKKLESSLADVDTDEAFTPDTEAVKDGYFHESEYRSAPYFAISAIDGIVCLNTKF